MTMSLIRVWAPDYLENTRFRKITMTFLLVKLIVRKVGQDNTHLPVRKS